MPAPDAKISKVAIDTKDLPLPAPVPIPGVNIPGVTSPGTGTGSTATPTKTTTTGSGANVLEALAAPAANALMSGALKQQEAAPQTASSGADGRSGDASSVSTFGDFIVNGSKGTSLTNFLIVAVIVGAGLLALKMIGKKK